MIHKQTFFFFFFLVISNLLLFFSYSKHKLKNKQSKQKHIFLYSNIYRGILAVSFEFILITAMWLPYNLICMYYSVKPKYFPWYIQPSGLNYSSSHLLLSCFLLIWKKASRQSSVYTSEPGDHTHNSNLDCLILSFGIKYKFQVSSLQQPHGSHHFKNKYLLWVASATVWVALTSPNRFNWLLIRNVT